MRVLAVKMKKTNNKKAIEMDMLGWWLIAIVVLVILIFAIMMLRGKGVGAIEYIQNLFRFKTAG